MANADKPSVQDLAAALEDFLAGANDEQIMAVLGAVKPTVDKAVEQVGAKRAERVAFYKEQNLSCSAAHKEIGEWYTAALHDLREERDTRIALNEQTRRDIIAAAAAEGITGNEISGRGRPRKEQE